MTLSSQMLTYVHCRPCSCLQVYFALLIFSFKINTEHYRDKCVGDSCVVCDLLLVLLSTASVIAVPKFHLELMEHHSICSQTQLNLEISH